MDAERGLSPATIATQRHYLKKFFKHTKKKQLSTFRITDVERFFVFLGKDGWTRAGIRGIAHYLRMFFRYGEQMGWTKPGIADAIRGPRVYQHEQLPLGPSWADVQRLLIMRRAQDLVITAVLIRSFFGAVARGILEAR
jgi:site-specific recombinase XerD